MPDMRHEPESLPRWLLMETLRSQWELDVETLNYAPVGFGSYHWVATCNDGSRRFVTADHLPSVGTQDGNTSDEHFEGLRAAFETARTLRDAGLEFVLAPEPAQTGELIARAGTDWSVAVFPFIESEPIGPGMWDDVIDALQVEAARLLGRLHRATPPATLRRWSSAIIGADMLLDVLADLDRPWRQWPVRRAGA